MQRANIKASLIYAFSFKCLLNLYSYDMRTTKQGNLNKQTRLYHINLSYSDNKTAKSTKFT